MADAKTTTNHDEIRKWAEERGGRPSRVQASVKQASVKHTGKTKSKAKGEDEGEDEGGGILRFDFGEKDEALEEISWEDFFDTFEKSELALLHQDKTADGKQSRFNKFVRRHGEIEHR